MMNQSTELNIQGHGLFPTPVVQADLPYATRINEDLRAVIEARRGAHRRDGHESCE